MVVPTMGSTGKAAKGAMPMTRRALVSRVPSPATCRMSCDNNLASEKGDSPLFALLNIQQDQCYFPSPTYSILKFLHSLATPQCV